jgi:phosphinothricin acetyltransferase
MVTIRAAQSADKKPAVRLASPDDADQILAIYAPIVSETAISFELEVPSVKEMRQRIVKTLAVLPWLIAEEGGVLLGYAYASQHRDRLAYQWSVDVSVYVSAQARRRGIARELYTRLLGILSAQGYYNVFAGIALPNDASVGVHEALGFRRVALYDKVGFKLGDWRDVGWWSFALRERAGTPVPPRALSELLASGEVAKLLA